jgi:flavodoxin
MHSLHDPQRRKIMAALASLPLLGAAGSSQGTADQGTASQGAGKLRSDSPVLVAYFSRSGNTRVVAGLIQRAARAQLFEIMPANAYPDEYLATVEQARQERDRDFEPALAAKVHDIGDYHSVFLGFPVWGETAPPVIRSFLSSHDLSGKTLIPFITHGGYGLGDSLSVLASHARNARLLEGFAMQADQERKTMEQVSSWLNEAKLPA